MTSFVPRRGWFALFFIAAALLAACSALSPTPTATPTATTTPSPTITPTPTPTPIPGLVKGKALNKVLSLAFSVQDGPADGKVATYLEDYSGISQMVPVEVYDAHIFNPDDTGPDFDNERIVKFDADGKDVYVPEQALLTLLGENYVKEAESVSKNGGDLELFFTMPSQMMEMVAGPQYSLVPESEMKGGLATGGTAAHAYTLGGKKVYVIGRYDATPDSPKGNTNISDDSVIIIQPVSGDDLEAVRQRMEEEGKFFSDIMVVQPSDLGIGQEELGELPDETTDYQTALALWFGGNIGNVNDSSVSALGGQTADEYFSMLPMLATHHLGEEIKNRSGWLFDVVRVYNSNGDRWNGTLEVSLNYGIYKPGAGGSGSNKTQVDASSGNGSSSADSTQNSDDKIFVSVNLPMKSRLFQSYTTTYEGKEYKLEAIFSSLSTLADKALENSELYYPDVRQVVSIDFSSPQYWSAAGPAGNSVWDFLASSVVRQFLGRNAPEIVYLPDSVHEGKVPGERTAKYGDVELEGMISHITGDPRILAENSNMIAVFNIQPPDIADPLHPYSFDGYTKNGFIGGIDQSSYNYYNAIIPVEFAKMAGIEIVFADDMVFDESGRPEILAEDGPVLLEVSPMIGKPVEDMDDFVEYAKSEASMRTDKIINTKSGDMTSGEFLMRFIQGLPDGSLIYTDSVGYNPVYALANYVLENDLDVGVAGATGGKMKIEATEKDAVLEEIYEKVYQTLENGELPKVYTPVAWYRSFMGDAVGHQTYQNGMYYFYATSSGYKMYEFNMAGEFDETDRKFYNSMFSVGQTNSLSITLELQITPKTQNFTLPILLPGYKEMVDELYEGEVYEWVSGLTPYP